jgi:Secretion system C-terminal sorting domain
VATAPGTYSIGPFPANTEVEVTLENELNPLCNVRSGVVTNDPPCPIISCGPTTYDYCYENSDTYMQVFQGTSTYPMRIQFNSGGIYQFDGDLLTIYDGLSDASPVLYSGTGVNGDLTGLFWTSTNPEHAITLKMVSTQFTGCADGNAVPWNYTVACLDCNPPAGTAGPVNTDCDAQNFTVTVNVTDLGTDPELEIANNVGAPPTLVTAPGTYTAGPFTLGNPVTITLVNDANSLCNVGLGTFINTFCPIEVTCGAPAIEQTHCYTDQESTVWLYQNTGTESLAILFSSLIMEGWQYDNVRIYDGINDQAPLLWENDFFNQQFGQQNFSGLLVISTGPALYMVASSDGIISCGGGSFGYEPWQWTVGCLDCTQPDVEFDVVLNCEEETWFISSDIASVGSDPTINITNTYNSDVIPVTAPGTYLSGPFPFGTVARVELVTDSNTLCSIRSDYTTNPPCPVVSCEEAQYTYCYPNGADTAMTYQSDNAFPIAMVFNTGQMSTFGDSIYVYDGANYLSPLLFSGTTVDGDLSGLLFTASNPANALTMKIRSDFFTSCFDAGFTPMDWTVSCLNCTNPTVSFSLVPDCLHNGFLIQVDVDSLGVNCPNLRIANSLDTDTVENVLVGTTLVGPFPVDSVVSLTVLNAQNGLCRRVSEQFTWSSDSCVNVACTPTGEEYCYPNADTAWFVYTSGTDDPVTISFLYGQLLVNDYIQIFNGLDTSAQIVYMGNQGGQIGGLAISSNNPDNALTLLVISSQAGSCATGQGFPPLYWEIGCGLVGTQEFHMDGFQMFPNPTAGALDILPGEGLSGMVNIDVLDITGRAVLSERFNATVGRKQSFDLGVLPNGTYAVRLYNQTWSKTQQLQVVR